MKEFDGGSKMITTKNKIRVGDELQKLSTLESTLSCGPLRNDDVYEKLLYFIREFYVYHMKLIIYQYDLQPVSVVNHSIYFLFDDNYFGILVDHFDDRYNNLKCKVDHQLLIRSYMNEKCKNFSAYLQCNDYENAIVNIYNDIAFDSILDFMIHEVAGNKEVVKTLKSYNLLSKKFKKVLAQKC